MNKSYYAIIPASVRYDEDLTMGARLLYGEITALTNEKGYCWATNEYFASLYNKSKTTISKWISQLEASRHIETSLKYREGTKEIEGRYIRILKEGTQENLKTLPKKTSIPYVRKLKDPPQENLKDNITMNNTLNITSNTTTNTIEDVEQKNCSTLPYEKNDSEKINVEYPELENPKKQNPLPAAKFQPEISEVVNYLNDVVGRNFDPDATANAKYVRGRLKDGATVDEMKSVIDFKARQWLKSEKMANYLRPKTLFAKSNFNEYLSEISTNRKKIEANRRLKKVVDQFVQQQNLVFSWDTSELESLEKIATRLKGLMKERGDPMTMDNLQMVLVQLLNRMDQFYKRKFSLKLINSNFNQILNGAKNNKESEWDSWVAQFN